MIDLQAMIDEIHERLQGEAERGAVANYIPELAGADLGKLGIAISTVDGQTHGAGDAELFRSRASPRSSP